MSIFNSQDYKVFIREQIDRNAETRGYQSKLAEAARCQKSYFSRVVRSGQHLSPDQAMGLAIFWALPSDEADWFLELVNLARAQAPALKRRIQERLKQIAQKREDLAERFKQPRIGPTEKEYLYYSSWQWSAIHILTSIPAYRKLESIAERLGLAKEYVHEILLKLESMGVVKSVSGSWSVVPGGLFAPKESFLSGSHHNNWRQRAVLDAQRLNHESIHYTDICSLSLDDFARLKEQLREWIESFRKQVKISKEEELACFCVDLFRA